MYCSSISIISTMHYHIYMPYVVTANAIWLTIFHTVSIGALFAFGILNNIQERSFVPICIRSNGTHQFFSLIVTYASILRSILSILRNLSVLIDLSFISTICLHLPVWILVPGTVLLYSIAQYLLIGTIQYQTPSRVKFMIDEDKTEYFIGTINFCQLEAN